MGRMVGGFRGTRMVMEAMKKSESGVGGGGGLVDNESIKQLSRKPNAKKLLRILRTEVFFKTCAEQMHSRPSGTDGTGDNDHGHGKKPSSSTK